MPEQWFYEESSAIIGPITESGIMRLYHAGEISNDTKVCREGDNSWELFIESELAEIIEKRAGRLELKPIAPVGKAIALTPEEKPAKSRSRLALVTLLLLAAFIGAGLFFGSKAGFLSPERDGANQQEIDSVFRLFSAIRGTHLEAALRFPLNGKLQAEHIANALGKLDSKECPESVRNAIRSYTGTWERAASESTEDSDFYHLLMRIGRDSGASPLSEEESKIAQSFLEFLSAAREENVFLFSTISD